MSRLVDIVNFNSDASCLSSARWLEILRGGADSLFCRWLSLYVQHRKKMALGVTGATASDLYVLNPAAAAIIRDNPEVFQILLRPFSHDIALLRTTDGFNYNLDAGRAVLKKVFGRVSTYYLPPEFMLMNEQVAALAQRGVSDTFINATRYSHDLRARIPKRPYLVHGVLGARLGCIPVDGELTPLYLRAIQLLANEEWNEAMEKCPDTNRLWRDGESSFLIPEGLDREEFWLKNCTAKRVHLEKPEYGELENIHLYQSYPIHSFADWMKELRMVGYIDRVRDIEKRQHQLSPDARRLWLLTINSDILSSVEKKSPLVKLRLTCEDNHTEDFRIFRSERSFEGEEYLALLDQCLRDDARPRELTNRAEPHLVKAVARMAMLEDIELSWSQRRAPHSS